MYIYILKLLNNDKANMLGIKINNDKLHPLDSLIFKKKIIMVEFKDQKTMNQFSLPDLHDLSLK